MYRTSIFNCLSKAPGKKINLKVVQDLNKGHMNWKCAILLVML